MVEWAKVVIPGVPQSHIGSDGGLLCAEVDSHKLLEEQRRAHPVRSLLEKLRGRSNRPDRHILKVWRRARDGDYTVAQLVYRSDGELLSVRHERIYANDDVGEGRPVETLVARSQSEIVNDIWKFFAGAPGADRLVAEVSAFQGTAV